MQQVEDVKQKIKATNLERYGVEYAMQSKEVRDKIKATNLERYGYENAMQNEEVQNKVRKTRKLTSFNVRVKAGMPEVLAKAIHDNNQDQIKRELENIITQNNIKTREDLSEFIRYDYSCCNQLILKTSLSHLFPTQHSSKPESEILDFLHELLLNESIEQSNRSILQGKELDLYIPTRNLAIS